MPVRKEVAELLSMGPLPASNVATEEDLNRREAALKAISRPVSYEEALALMSAFGTDECFGLAWTLLHLIETAPTRPRMPEDILLRSEWLRMVWKDS
jgi:hypothetical protein